MSCWWQISPDQRQRAAAILICQKPAVIYEQARIAIP